MVVRLDSFQAALPLTAFVGGLAIIPIALTNDVWGDLTVLFLFWWAIGYSAARPERVRSETPETAGAAPPRVVPT